ncbi:hypothetical protein [Microseira wollei]|nr:hypothetical protein [Microseira wollei]
MAGETRKVLGNPVTCAKTLVRSSRTASKVPKTTPKRKREPMYE